MYGGTWVQDQAVNPCGVSIHLARHFSNTYVSILLAVQGRPTDFEVATLWMHGHGMDEHGGAR